MEYVIVGAIVGAVIAVFYVWAKKTAAETAELVSGISDEVKNKLAMTDVVFDGDNEWTQDAVIAKIIDKEGKVALKLLWHNKTIQNNDYDKLSLADLTIKKEELEAHNLKEGDIVKLHMAPEKTIGSVSIKYE